MEQTAKKTEADYLENRESPNESPIEQTEINLQNPEIYLSQDEDAINEEKVLESVGNLRGKKYSKITDEQRRDFINAVENNGEKIIHAAKRFDINYSSAKSILNVFKNEGRSIKKQFRDKIPKNQKTSPPGVGEEAAGTSRNNFDQLGGKGAMTTHASTQTSEDFSQDNSLVLLRDRLLASKTDKRQNPYEGLSSHDFSRFSGSLSDYTQSQLSCDPNREGGNSDQNKTSQDYFPAINNQQNPSMMNSVQPIQYPEFLQNDPNSNSNMNNNSRNLIQTQNSGQSQFGFQMNKPPYFDSQSQQVGGMMSNQNQGIGGGLNYRSDTGLEQRQQQGMSQNNERYSSMIYTGVNPVQYLVMNPANNQMRGMQMDQFQYLQPIMYVVPSLQNLPFQQQNNPNSNLNTNMNQPPSFPPIGNYNPQQTNYNQNQGPPNQQRGGMNFNNQNSNMN